jgi:predicted ATPase
MTIRHVVLSGCSGGGKSTLLAELARRGFATVPEPGRRIVEEELRGDGAALPWVDLAAFAGRAIAMAAEDRRRMAGAPGWVFFDRGLIDAAAALEHATGRPARDVLAPHPRYHPRVFLTPPWPEIYATDAERRHDLSEAVEEYERLVEAYRGLGYETCVLPKVSVGERAEFVLRGIG